MKPKEVIRILEKDGWTRVASKGSHLKYKKGNKRTTIAYHNKDLLIATLKRIEEQTGLKLR